MKKAAAAIFLFLMLFSFALNVGAQGIDYCKEPSKKIGCPGPKEGLVPCGNVDTCPCCLCDLFVMLDRIIDFVLFTIAPLLAVVMIAVGAFMMIMAYAGSAGPETINKAKKLFASIAIGLLIIYAAWAAVYLFLDILGIAELAGFDEGGWRINCGN